MLLLILANPRENPNAMVMGKLGANQSQFNLRMVVALFRMPKMWMFILYVVGVACVYDVFDQQFANFFKTFFSSPQRGTEVFGYATTAGELANALIMFCSPWIINRIGAKNTLLLAGTIMSIRIIGSAFATTALEVIMLKMLHALEVPFLLVGSFKYITANFDTRLSATIYLIGFQFAKQGAAIFLSAFAGSLYDRMGFADTYLILGCLALGVTLISVFTLSSPDKKIQPQAKAQEATS
jgi:OHS family lactose permease-like MFS transporter